MPAVDAPPAAPVGLAITEAGLGTITATTKADLESLKTALPGYELEKKSIPQGGDLVDEHVAATKGGTLAVKIYGDATVRSVEVVSDEIKNPWGLTIGMTHDAATKILGPLECLDGAETADWRNYVIECSSDKSKNWSFDFQREGTPAKEVIGKPALAEAKLVALRWEMS